VLGELKATNNCKKNYMFKLCEKAMYLTLHFNNIIKYIKLKIK